MLASFDMQLTKLQTLAGLRQEREQCWFALSSPAAAPSIFACKPSYWRCTSASLRMATSAMVSAMARAGTAAA